MFTAHVQMDRARHLISWVSLIVFVLTESPLNAAEPETAPKKQNPILEIHQSFTLDPKQTYGAIAVMASGIVIDGQGAWLIGRATGKPKEFKGTAILASGVSNVTLKNINTKGWETGLKLTDAAGCTIENCDFSTNFHDPDCGWGENGRRGGIVLEQVTKSTLRKDKANHVWDGCVLVDSDDNSLEENDFSHTSNTCLKLWTACRNSIRNNVLSHGIRISPVEVHARDSTGVLIESGSNDNRFIGNDCTHGGDGIFVRVLNGWCSTGNLFEKNDCSYANNNGIECWAPRNDFVKNKANHYAGFRVALRYPKINNAHLRAKTKLVFWLKSINEDVTGWQGGPFISIDGDNEQRRWIEPKPGLDLMRQLDHNEAREGWRLMEIPLNGNEQWQIDGDMPANVRSISLCFDSWCAPPLRFWIDGLAFE